MEKESSSQCVNNESAWISRGFEQLVDELQSQPSSKQENDFDLVIVGSGYGGAVAAAQLTDLCDENGKALRVCILERGKEYLQGMFPSSLSSLAGHARFTSPFDKKPAGNRDGLFDIRAGKDINVLVANGVGGGSLINAGVMEVPEASIFDRRWPDQLRGGEDLVEFFDKAKNSLGAQVNGKANTIREHVDLENKKLLKYQAMEKLAGEEKNTNFRAAHITVSMSDSTNSANVPLNKCKLCGDCATGCNHGAKNSLDLNLLVRAYRLGARIYTGATVQSVVQSRSDSWVLTVNHTDAQLAKREGKSTEIKAGRIILAAGALGSTEILLRSRDSGLSVSDQLGCRFSGNGDMLAVGYDQSEAVNAIADEVNPPDDRKIGPTITSVIDRRTQGNQQGIVIEEMAVPGPMRRVFEEIFATANTFYDLIEPGKYKHLAGHLDLDPLAINRDVFHRTSLYAVMGNDDAEGRVELQTDFDKRSDSGVVISWPTLRTHTLFESQIEQMENMTVSAGVGGRVIANPVWRPFPRELQSITGLARGPLLTVHPLGGCAMGNTIDSGVVDHLGRVFRVGLPGQNVVHEGLVVLDGAIVPCALGTNPALTISALSYRAVEGLIDSWGLRKTGQRQNRKLPPRPVYKDPGIPSPTQATVMQFVERLRGRATLKLQGTTTPCVIEITLYFKDKKLQDLTTANDNAAADKHRLDVAIPSGDDSASSGVRVFKAKDWDSVAAQHLSRRSLDEALERITVLSAPLTGSLTIMGREPSQYPGRVWRSFWPAVANRLARDVWQTIWPLAHERKQEQADASSAFSLSLFFKKIGIYSNIFSHAGECRLFEYDLQMGELGEGQGAALDLSQSRKIKGNKRITYNRRANPLRQLLEINLLEFPGLKPSRKKPVLTLVPEFLARKGLPLFRIKNQHDTPQALMDLVSLSSYFVRLFMSIHPLCFREPDRAEPYAPRYLPGVLSGLPTPEIKEIPVIMAPDGSIPAETNFRLTRYPQANSDHPPVLMIHGYSASGTTFAHPQVTPNLASHLWMQGRDVWVLDMRSSCGMPSAKENWSFEDMAYADIPLAINHVFKTRGRPVDIVAHCMGAAMFSMAVLNEKGLEPGVPYREERGQVSARVNKAVLSQVGPLVSMAPENIFRAYLFTYLKHTLPLENYSFSPERESREPGLVERLFDRALQLLPYSDADYDIENPWPPWRRTAFSRARHRIDLLYGKTFSLANLSPEVLRHIDDFFGPLSVDTATQVAHFAKYQTITNHGGDNEFVSREKLQKSWVFPTLSVHGEDNGLADVSTVGRMEAILSDAGCDFQKTVFSGFGHQDSLIGEQSQEVFDAIEQFFRRESSPVESESTPIDFTIQVPWSGPVIGTLGADVGASTLPVMFGINPALSVPKSLVLVPLTRRNGRLDVTTKSGSEQEVLNASLVSIPDPVDGWVSTCVPVPEAPVECLLLLLVYDEAPTLDNASFGKGRDHIDRFETPAHFNLNDAFVDEEVSRFLKACVSRRRKALAQSLNHFLEAGPNHLRSGIISIPQRPEQNTLNFALGSCQYPGGIVDEHPAYRSYARLARRIEERMPSDSPNFVVLMGDQIYVDATAGLFDPSERVERFVHPYQHFYRSSAVRSVLRRLPSYWMLDDHEIIDNWQPLSSNSETDLDLDLGRAAYVNFQRGIRQPVGHNNNGKLSALWYSFVENGFHFFVADSRTDREPRTSSNVSSAELFSQDQMNALRDWLIQQSLDDDPYRPKFIVSPAMLLPRYKRSFQGGHRASAIHSDAWDGYPQTLQRILRLITQIDIQNVIFLSGNAHLSCLAEIKISDSNGGQAQTIWSIHSSALYAPLPFANADRADIAAEDEFVVPHELPSGEASLCQVSTQFAAEGDGFTYLKIEKREGGWAIQCEFDREATDGREENPFYFLLDCPVSECS